MVSHEIRTPLNIIYSGLDLLKADLIHCGCSDESLDTWNVINRCTEMSVAILDELLLYEKLESGVMQLDQEVLPLWELLRDAICPFQLQVCAHHYYKYYQFDLHDMHF
jgi:signal transduction histidine kinase